MTRQQLQQGFTALMDEHRRLLHKVCRVYCRNKDDRDDLAQEITVQLWRAYPGYDPDYKFSTWMYRIALNVAISFYRRESRRTRPLLTGDDHLLDVVDESRTSNVTDRVEQLYQ